jgi:hypothetical protein
MLSSPVSITIKEVCSVSFGILPPRVPAELREIPSPRLGESLSACLSSLCFALVDEKD